MGFSMSRSTLGSSRILGIISTEFLNSVLGAGALPHSVSDLEAEHQFHLFTRDKRRIVELTDAGRVFVQEARSAVSHTERAVHLARAAHNGSDTILTIGRSPYANHDWVSALLAICLPLYPRLEIRLKTQFAKESVHSVLVGEVNLALVTAPPEDTQITAVPFAPAPLYAVLPENHPAARQGSIKPFGGQCRFQYYRRRNS